MAKANNKQGCLKCGKFKSTSKCTECSDDFCFDHLAQHQQDLSLLLDYIENDRNLFIQLFNEYKDTMEINKFTE
ncbi:hypothetical protein I4U23_016441 [Adineta vaga]|nr:hypothetical protein I4U23_016441 [Adineta vaga]